MERFSAGIGFGDKLFKKQDVNRTSTYVYTRSSQIVRCYELKSSLERSTGPLWQRRTDVTEDAFSNPCVLYFDESRDRKAVQEILIREKDSLTLYHAYELDQRSMAKAIIAKKSKGSPFNRHPLYIGKSADITTDADGDPLLIAAKLPGRQFKGIVVTRTRNGTFDVFGQTAQWTAKDLPRSAAKSNDEENDPTLKSTWEKLSTLGNGDGRWNPQGIAEGPDLKLTIFVVQAGEVVPYRPKDSGGRVEFEPLTRFGQNVIGDPVLMTFPKAGQLELLVPEYRGLGHYIRTGKIDSNDWKWERKSSLPLPTVGRSLFFRNEYNGMSYALLPWGNRLKHFEFNPDAPHAGWMERGMVGFQVTSEPALCRRLNPADGHYYDTIVVREGEDYVQFYWLDYRTGEWRSQPF